MFCIRIADLNIEINNRYEYTEKMCRDYIVKLAESSGACKVDMHIEVSEEDILKEQQEGEVLFSLDYCEFICIYRAISEKLIDFDAFLVHGACVEYDGNAYIFLAKSGTGKSTHICLWKKVYGDGVRIINGDKPIVRKRQDGYYAYGTPWCGKEEWNINDSARLKYLCFLERGAENTIEPMENTVVMNRLCHQILMPKDKGKLIKYLDMMDDLIRNTKSHLLHCNMEDEAAVVAFQGMQED